jgi:hypothetical protein
MQTLFWKLFPPYEVRLTAEEVRGFLKGAELCRAEIEPKVMALVKDAEKTVYSVRIDRMKPDHLALLLITNVLSQELSSGQHHTYRGMLSLIGKDMLGLWHNANKEMVARGFMPQSEADSDTAELQRNIKEMG